METLQLMEENNKKSFGVVNEQVQLMGMITKSDLSEIGLGDTAIAIRLLKKTPTEFIVKTINGTIRIMIANVISTARSASWQLLKHV